MYEAATVDGASRSQQFWHITMPSLRPAHYIVLALSLIDSFKVFDLIYAMTYGGPGTATQVMGTWMYFNVFQYYQAGYGTAIAVVITVVADCRQHPVRAITDQGACRMSTFAEGGELAPVAALPDAQHRPNRMSWAASRSRKAASGSPLSWR